MPKFPSPTGDLYFSIDGWFTDDYQTVFPSPTGDLYFSIRLSKTNIQYLFVSVPYRGLIFLNNATVGVAKDPKKVSVPYRGLIFLNIVS